MESRGVRYLPPGRGEMIHSAGFHVNTFHVKNRRRRARNMARPRKQTGSGRGVAGRAVLSAIGRSRGELGRFTAHSAAPLSSIRSSPTCSVGRQ